MTTQGHKTIRLSLKAGERLYVNGAVLRVDRRTSIELLNDVVFLLEHHVMQPEEATTPLRQLYFIVQKALIEPAAAFSARQKFYRHYIELLGTHEGDAEVLKTLERVRALVNTGRVFEALKTIRALYEEEEAREAATRKAREATARPRAAAGK